MKRVIEPMHEEHVNVTPLIDVVMCLIIFFLLCGQLAKDQSVASIDVPKAVEGQDLPEKNGQVIINVRAKMDQDGKPIPAADPDYIIRGVTYTSETLNGELKSESQTNKDMKVVVRADRSLPYKAIEPVLTACASAAIQSVNFVTKEE